MADEKKDGVIGYYTEDENIYCVKCIFKNIEIMKKVDQALTEDSSTENLVCDGCGKELKGREKSDPGE